MKQYFLMILWLAGNMGLSAQLPKTDVMLASFHASNGMLVFDNIQYLSDFNPNGYNNQAYFFGDDLIYLTSNYKNEGFTDILALSPKKNTFFKVTDTQGISEFSPTPASNKEDFYTVRIEKDGKGRSLWKYPLSRLHYGERLFPTLHNIDYYCWISPTQVAIFLVAEPHLLAIGNTLNGSSTTITDNPGRCLKTNGKGLLYFVHKVSADLWILKSYDLNENKMLSICKMPEGVEDFEYITDGTFLATSKGKILTFDPKKSLQWNEVADLSPYGITNIQQPIIKNNQLLFIHAK